MHRGPPGDAQGRDVGLEGPERRRVELHELGRRRASREGLEPQRAAPGVEVEHPRARQDVTQDTHPGLPDPIRGGPYPGVLGYREPAAAELAGDDSHRRRRRNGDEGGQERGPVAHPGVWGAKRAQPRLEGRVAVPLVGLEPERRVHRPVAEPGHPVGPLEPDGAEPGPAVVERALEVPVARPATDPRTGRPRTPNTGLALPAPHGSRWRHIRSSSRVASARPQLEIHPLLGAEVLRAEHLARDAAEALAELVEPVARGW